MRRIDKLLLLVLSAVFLYWLLIMLMPTTTGPLISLYYWFQGATFYVGYWGAFLISLLGNATVLVPFPYVAVVFLLGGAKAGIGGVYLFDPWLVGIAAGIGATLGELVGYILGYFGSRFVNKKQTSGFLELTKRYPRMTPAIIWFLALTPIADDALIVPLGVAKYPWRKIIIPLTVGKTMFMIILAWAGRLGLDWVEAILESTLDNPLTKTVEVLGLVFIILSVYFMIRINWEKLASKFALKGRTESPIYSHRQ